MNCELFQEKLIWISGRYIKIRNRHLSLGLRNFQIKSGEILMISRINILMLAS